MDWLSPELHFTEEIVPLERGDNKVTARRKYAPLRLDCVIHIN